MPTPLCSNPILIGQFMLGADLAGAGDPAFALVPDCNQWLDRYIFNVPVGDYNDFLGIAIERSALASLQLDGAPVNPASFSPVPGTTLVAGNVTVIPTLSPWALAVLAGLIGILAVAGLRRRAG